MKRIVVLDVNVTSLGINFTLHSLIRLVTSMKETWWFKKYMRKIKTDRVCPWYISLKIIE